MDFSREWTEKTEVREAKMIEWLGITRSKYYAWRKCYGKVQERNGWVPRDHWLSAEERSAILKFQGEYPLEGYRRLTFMMIDRDIVAASPSSVYRVLREAGRLQHWRPRPSRKGKGFEPPLRANAHWHVDISYLNICATFYYIISILDGYSRYIVHWELRESMTEADVELTVQRARERFPEERPRIISDNGPQFIARDFKEFIRITGLQHVKTSPYYPQSNGKIERWHRTLKGECLRVKTPLSLEEARRIMGEFVKHYNTVRLHSAIGYVTPEDKLAGRDAEIFAERERKLAEARDRRRELRQNRLQRVATISA